MTQEKGRRLAYFVGALLAAPSALLVVFVSAGEGSFAARLLLFPVAAFWVGWGLTRLWIWYKAGDAREVTKLSRGRMTPEQIRRFARVVGALVAAPFALFAAIRISDATVYDRPVYLRADAITVGAAYFVGWVCTRLWASFKAA